MTDNQKTREVYDHSMDTSLMPAIINTVANIRFFIHMRGIKAIIV